MIPTCTWKVDKGKFTPANTSNSAETGICLPYGRTLVGLDLDMCCGVNVTLFHSKENSLHCSREGHKIFGREII